MRSAWRLVRFGGGGDVGLIGRILRSGRAAEPVPPRPEQHPAVAGLGGSLQVRHVDAGYEEAKQFAEKAGVRIPMDQSSRQ